jgi:YaiO family outer membrane protein
MARALRAALVMLVLSEAGLEAQEPESGRRRTDITYAGAEYNNVYFHGDIDPWHLLALSLGNRGARGTYISRVNLARRFDQDGAQAELDAYPRINEKLYGFLNIGYSGSDIFPEWRSGAELFAALPNAWEASAGYRQLRFEGAPPVTLLTGAVGKYFGNSWISARPYVRVGDNGTGATVIVTGRRYFADADNYIGARIGAGSSPSENATPAEVNRNRSWSAALQGSRTLRARIVGTWSAGIEREELSASVTRRRIDLLIGLRFEL